jgi:hypothetical protein
MSIFTILSSLFTFNKGNFAEAKAQENKNGECSHNCFTKVLFLIKSK